MNFDPGELYDDDYDDIGEPETTEEVEFDELGNPVYLATAAGFGYHMIADELEERQLAENILKRREGKKDKPAKVPLADRHTTRGNMTPFARWATKANLDHKNAGDDIEYTKEERHQIYDAEGDWDG